MSVKWSDPPGFNVDCMFHTIDINWEWRFLCLQIVLKIFSQLTKFTVYRENSCIQGVPYSYINKYQTVFDGN